jgi:hypothetical protein
LAAGVANKLNDQMSPIWLGWEAMGWRAEKEARKLNEMIK